MPKLTYVIPCYYNELNIPVTGKKLIEYEQLYDADVTFEYLFVDDGSKDGTLRELLAFQQQYPDRVRVIKLARNFGANNASLCGITNMTGDCGVLLSADLQDPPELVPKLFSHWRNGYKLVVAQRTDREDPWHQKLFSHAYHGLMRRLAVPNAPRGGMDLWLFDQHLKSYIASMQEKNTYLPYLFMWLGFEYVSIPYTRRKRELGKSRWTLSKKIKSFIDSFVAFSFFPIRMISVMGLLLGTVALLYAIWIVISRLMGNIDVAGWSGLMVVMLLLGSFQMVGLGILGEYVWRAMDASRGRPNFVIDRIYPPTGGIGGGETR